MKRGASIAGLAIISTAALLLTAVLATRRPFSYEHTVTPYDVFPPGNASRRVAIVQYASASSDSWLSKESLAFHKAYADLHSYPYFSFSTRMATEGARAFRDGRITGSGIFGYDKLAYILQVMVQGLEQKTFDYILWSDADTLITDPSLLIESYLPENVEFRSEQEPFVIMASDHNGLNDGTILFKCNWWSISLLAQAIADPYQRHSGILRKYSDQRSLLRVVAEDSHVDGHVHHMTRDWLNSSLQPGEQCRNNSLQIHLLGTHKKQVAFLDAAASALDGSWKNMRVLQEQGQWENQVVRRNQLIRLEAREFWEKAAIYRPPLKNWDLEYTRIRFYWPFFLVIPAALIGSAVAFFIFSQNTQFIWKFTPLPQNDMAQI